MAYQAGKPIVTDEEYDQLKRELRNKNSMVVQQVRIFPLLSACGSHHSRCLGQARSRLHSVGSSMLQPQLL